MVVEIQDNKICFTLHGKTMYITYIYTYIYVKICMCIFSIHAYTYILIHKQNVRQEGKHDVYKAMH